MLLIIVITLSILCIFILYSKYYNEYNLKQLETFKENNVVLPIDVAIVDSYNSSLEQIQNQFEDQVRTINNIKTSTYSKSTVDDIVDNLSTNIDSTKSELSGKISEIEKDLHFKASYDYINTNFDRKEDTLQLLQNNYATINHLETKFAELDKNNKEILLSKQAAKTLYADKNKVYELEKNVSNLNNTKTIVDNSIKSINNQLQDYATKSDLTTYARYTDFVDINNRVSKNVVNLNTNYDTVSKFISTQSDVNKTFLDKTFVLQNDILLLNNDHQKLVDKLGNYLNAEEVNNLLQNSYASLSQFNVLSEDVDILDQSVSQLKKRTQNVETDLLMRQNRICLKNPGNVDEDVCMVGGDFEIMKDIIGKYYQDQLNDSIRLQELETSRAKSESQIRELERTLEEAEYLRQKAEEDNRLAREALRKQAIDYDKEIQTELSNAISKFQITTQEYTDSLASQIEIDKRNLEMEKENISNLNSKIEGLNSKLALVEEEDKQQNKTIQELRIVVEEFEVEKKRLTDTINDRNATISVLEQDIIEKEDTITQQEQEILVKEEQLITCEGIKNQCVNVDLPYCEDEVLSKKKTINEKNAKITNLNIDISKKVTEYNKLSSKYTILEEECEPKITQYECDNQPRQVFELDLKKNGEPILLKERITIRITNDKDEESRLLDMEKARRVQLRKEQFMYIDTDLADSLNNYPSIEYEWVEHEQSCPDWTALIKSLEDARDKNYNSYQSCMREYGILEIDRDNYKTKYLTEESDHNICKTDKKIIEKERDDCILNRCRDCNYNSVVKGKLDSLQEIHTFCYLDQDDLTKREKALGGQWANIDVMHKPHCDQEKLTLQNRITELENEVHWVKFHGIPNGTEDLLTQRTLNIYDCKSLCENTNNCSLYVFNTQSKECNLKQNIPVFETFTNEDSKKKASINNTIEHFRDSTIYDRGEVMSGHKKNYTYLEKNIFGEIKSDEYAYMEHPPTDCVLNCVYGPCNKETGMKTKSCTIVTPAKYGGKCPDLISQEPCPVDCDFRVEWGPCMSKCGKGTTTGNVKILHSSKNGGNSCPSSLTEIRECENAPCVGSCEYGEWDIPDCPVQCGRGTRISVRRRRDKPGLPPPSNCPETQTQEQECIKAPCPNDCQVSGWSDWGPCTKTCGGGKQTRTRSIISNNTSGGISCPSASELVEEISCNTQDCACEKDVKQISQCNAVCRDGPNGFKRTAQGTKVIEYNPKAGACKPNDLTETQSCSKDCYTFDYSMVDPNNDELEVLRTQTLSIEPDTDIELAKKRFQNMTPGFKNWTSRIDCRVFKSAKDPNIILKQEAFGMGTNCECNISTEWGPCSALPCQQWSDNSEARGKQYRYLHECAKYTDVDLQEERECAPKCCKLSMYEHVNHNGGRNDGWSYFKNITSDYSVNNAGNEPGMSNDNLSSFTLQSFGYPERATCELTIYENYDLNPWPAHKTYTTYHDPDGRYKYYEIRDLKSQDMRYTDVNRKMMSFDNEVSSFKVTIR